MQSAIAKARKAFKKELLFIFLVYTLIGGVCAGTLFYAHEPYGAIMTLALVVLIVFDATRDAIRCLKRAEKEHQMMLARRKNQ